MTEVLLLPCLVQDPVPKREEASSKAPAPTLHTGGSPAENIWDNLWENPQIQPLGRLTACGKTQPML